ncbi:GroES-like protein [Pseudovirgaria hyperparasitica]|uniref:GroES-like protein n=1 Tax=Pseudovirgaria hyperparasitica TaxID=470096 RepID=A0A6A6W7V3_9PEZI|nr:GroES-like protein [Pseudovirgaria hyperparasitica]KAF2758723.1 GroES-like protein [Pseudovirgaria hyperparasitica]
MTTNAPPSAPAQDLTVPTECWAGVVDNPGADFVLKVEKVPVPSPAPDQVLLRLNATGLCYSDLHYMLNDLGMGLPCMKDFGVRSPGHEGAGYVVKVGEAVKGWSIGDRAGMKPLWDTCGSCNLCFSGMGPHCAGAVQAGLFVTGTYQQFILAPAKYLNRIPSGVSDYVAGPVMCSASTMYRALANSGLKAGDFACFPGGGGGVGIQGVQLAKAMGFRPVVTDSGADKKKLALEMGAEAFVDFREVEDVPKAVVEACDGIGAHGVFVTAVPSYKQAVAFTGMRPGAVVVCIGLPPEGTSLGADPLKYVFQGLQIKGSLVGDLHDTHMALDFARRGSLKQICEVWPLHRMPEAVDKLREGKVAGRIVIDFNDDAEMTKLWEKQKSTSA